MEDVVEGVVVVASVVVGTELELELELELEVVGTVLGSAEVVGSEVVWAEVVAGSLLVVSGLVTEVVAGWEAAAVVLSRLTSLRKLAIFSSSSWRASAAFMSVGKMPCWNFLDNACRAS